VAASAEAAAHVAAAAKTSAVTASAVTAAAAKTTTATASVGCSREQAGGEQGCCQNREHLFHLDTPFSQIVRRGAARATSRDTERGSVTDRDGRQGID
jgi:uncharacterized protein